MRTCSFSTRPTGATSPTTSRARSSAQSWSADGSPGGARLVSMPTRKQRRRRAKERRHEYEYVYVEVDEEGREVEVEVEGDELEERTRSNGRAPRPVTRSGRVVEPPSWRRVAKRA